MIFTAQQLSLACQLKESDLIWEPATGQYVYDFQKCLRQGSPFQPQVYYFHDLACFVDHVGSIDELVKCLAWLPTFEECRKLLDTSPDLARQIEESIVSDDELDMLYRRLIAKYTSNPKNPSGPKSTPSE